MLRRPGCPAAVLVAALLFAPTMTQGSDCPDCKPADSDHEGHIGAGRPKPVVYTIQAPVYPSSALIDGCYQVDDGVFCYEGSEIRMSNKLGDTIRFVSKDGKDHRIYFHKSEGDVRPPFVGYQNKSYVEVFASMPNPPLTLLPKLKGARFFFASEPAPGKKPDFRKLMKKFRIMQGPPVVDADG